jgi:hypothetical protein
MSDKKSFLLRISRDVWESLAAWAADDLRSVNGQIEYLLRETLRARRGKAEERAGRTKEGNRE